MSLAIKTFCPRLFPACRPPGFLFILNSNTLPYSAVQVTLNKVTCYRQTIRQRSPTQYTALQALCSQSTRCHQSETSIGPHDNDFSLQKLHYEFNGNISTVSIVSATYPAGLIAPTQRTGWMDIGQTVAVRKMAPEESHKIISIIHSAYTELESARMTFRYFLACRNAVPALLADTAVFLFCFKIHHFKPVR